MVLICTNGTMHIAVNIVAFRKMKIIIMLENSKDEMILEKETIL